ncbi:DUF1501 domain-containing protein [Rhodospirillaceae bacterium KN72]|uniref:DUF1501 domain-containing protein n=1 Tax=Pacificispira spongiicola TaxID=2729598 RepID=A0A7Y0DWX6_9PROT|nr:DUF1501 domain-containing protein [Pacificispira spongiicola]NMM43129.1 DUF1501 domain-containing protein [Pacificispira spongiicola]
MTRPPELSSNRIDRRRFLAGSVAAAATVAGGVKLSLAAGPTDRPLIVIMLHGAPDGQALTPIYSDKHYADLRRELTLPPPDAPGGILDLDGRVGLHPSAGALLPIWQAGRMAVAPAFASPYRGTSALEAQAVLESGLPAFNPKATDGWLDRAVAAAGFETPVWRPAFGKAGDDALMARSMALYSEDGELSGLLQAALTARATERAAQSEDVRLADAVGLHAQNLAFACLHAGMALISDNGPRTARIDIGGWTTQRQQGGASGPLSRRIAGLADGIAVLADTMGEFWEGAMMLVLSAQGRSISPNTQGGTDPGLGGTALVLGGTLSKSQTLGDIPTLPEDGDALPATVDSRALIGSALARHWSLSPGQVRTIFPNAGTLPSYSL